MALGTRLLASLLFGVNTADPRAALGVVVMLVLVAAVATLAPAWRAANVHPAAILRRQ